MKVYLDSCSLQRPLDDQSHIRIASETEAIINVLKLWQEGKIELVGSEVLNYEANNIPQLERKSLINEILSEADTFIEINEEIEILANQFNENGIKPLDALHLACAVQVAVKYFCTCDDKFYKKAIKLDTKNTEVVTPIKLLNNLIYNDNE